MLLCGCLSNTIALMLLDSDAWGLKLALSTSYSATFRQLSAFLATFSLLSNFQFIGQLLSFCASIVTDMLLLRVKESKSAEYSLC